MIELSEHVASLERVKGVVSVKTKDEMIRIVIYV